MKRETPQRPFLSAGVDSLAAIRERPILIEHAVRTALVEAMTWRLGGGAPPSEVAFVCAAVAAARQAAARSSVRMSEVAVSVSTEIAARRFFRAPLGKRLIQLPQAHIVTTQPSSGGADVIVRDRARRLHLIALTALRRPLDINERARELYAETPLAPYQRLAPVRVHLYSLGTGKRHESLSSPAANFGGTDAKSA